MTRLFPLAETGIKNSVQAVRNLDVFDETVIGEKKKRINEPNLIASEGLKSIGAMRKRDHQAWKRQKDKEQEHT